MVFAEIVIIICGFVTSPLMGVFLSAYILYMKSLLKLERSKQREKLDAYKKELEEIKEQFEIRRKEEIKMLEKPRGFPEKIYPYKNCMIEQHINHFRVTGPDSKLLKKVFYSLESAKKDIDEYLCFIPVADKKARRGRR